MTTAEERRRNLNVFNAPVLNSLNIEEPFIFLYLADMYSKYQLFIEFYYRDLL